VKFVLVFGGSGLGLAADRQIQTHIPRLWMCDTPINFPIHRAMGWRFLRFPEMFFSQAKKRIMNSEAFV